LNRITGFIQQGIKALRIEGSFTQSYAIVLSGTGLNILIQVLVSPVLTRIYGPEAYGIFSLFNALCTNLALISTLRLPQALLLPPQERDFHVLMRACTLSALTTCLLVFVALFFAAGPFLALFQAEKLASFYLLIPAMVFLIALNQIVGQWQYRLNRFKRSVTIDTGVLIGVRVFNLLFGWLTKGMVLGLVTGDIIGKISGLLLSWRFIIKDQSRYFFSVVSWHELKSVFLRFKQYPLFNLPGVWLTTFSDQLSVFFISSAFGLPSVGILSLAVSMLDLPKRLFAYSVSSVFYRKAVELHQQSFEKLQIMVVRMLYLFLLISLIPYGTIAVFGPELFSWVFGSNWIVSGRIAQYFSVYCVLELLYFSLDSVYYVLREEKRLFFFQATTFVLRLLTLMLSIHFSLSLEHCAAFLAMTNIFLYAVQLSYLMHLLRLAWWKHMSFIFAMMAASGALFYGLRTFLQGAGFLNV
jgi:O-antigen/teichoic acid export membrane protein